MRIYIAGKITGLDPEESRKKFDEAEDLLEVLGHEAVNPMHAVDQTPGRAYEEYLRDALAHLLTCEAIYLLPDWLDSKGARVEAAIAVELGMKRIFEMRREDGTLVWTNGKRRIEIGHANFEQSGQAEKTAA